MSTPPRPGSVIRYAYLWRDQARGVVEEGRKDRPCAIVACVRQQDGHDLVYVLPVTSLAPRAADEAIELPAKVRRRLNLQAEPCWIVLTELNRFVWPGPDLRRVEKPAGLFCCFGELPADLYRRLLAALDARARAGRLGAITRSR